MNMAIWECDPELVSSRHLYTTVLILCKASKPTAKNLHYGKITVQRVLALYMALPGASP